MNPARLALGGSLSSLRRPRFSLTEWGNARMTEIGWWRFLALLLGVMLVMW